MRRLTVEISSVADVFIGTCGSSDTFAEIKQKDANGSCDLIDALLDIQPRDVEKYNNAIDIFSP